MSCFFSSRRRHTRFDCDWSSDVCSSDLMNIMLVSVTQRTREIGVEKALGARRWHILFQFLAEALVITLLGGLAGVALAYIVSWSVGSLTLWSAFIEDASEGDIHWTIYASTRTASPLI